MSLTSRERWRSSLAELCILSRAQLTFLSQCPQRLTTTVRRAGGYMTTMRLHYGICRLVAISSSARIPRQLSSVGQGILGQATHHFSHNEWDSPSLAVQGDVLLQIRLEVEVNAANLEPVRYNIRIIMLPVVCEIRPPCYFKSLSASRASNPKRKTHQNVACTYCLFIPKQLT